MRPHRPACALHRSHGRHADRARRERLPVGVREVVGEFAPNVSGHVLVTPRAAGVKQEPPLPVRVELARGAERDDALAASIRERLREVLVVQTDVDLVPWGSLAAQRVQVDAGRARVIVTTVVGSYPQPDWLIDRERLGDRLPPRVRARELWRVGDEPPRGGAGRRDAARGAGHGARRRRRRSPTARCGARATRTASRPRSTASTSTTPASRSTAPATRTRSRASSGRSAARGRSRCATSSSCARSPTAGSRSPCPGPFTMTQQAQNDHYADEREPRARVRRGGQRGAPRPQGGGRRRRPDRRAVPAGAARGGARVRASRRSTARSTGIEGDTVLHTCFGYAAIVHDRPAATRSSRELNDCAATQLSLEAAQPDLDPDVLRALAGQDDRARRARPRLARRRDAGASSPSGSGGRSRSSSRNGSSPRPTAA